MSDRADLGRWTLALDTATPATVAAAVRPGAGDDAATAARLAVPGPGERPGHTRLLLGLAEEVLRETGGGWDDVGRIVVGLGPGTFTGIRVGVATARALALGASAELVGVPTPWALAEAAGGPGAAHEGVPVLVVQDARRRELFLTLVPGRGPGARDPIGATDGPPRPYAVPRADLAAALRDLPTPPAVAVGDGALQTADELRAAGVAVPEDPAAHHVDGLALVRAAHGTPVVAPQELRPVYVRDADAVPTAERR